MKRSIAGMAAALLAAVLLFPVQAHAVSARSAVILDPTGGRFLYEKQPCLRLGMASTTKIMTGLVICQQCNVLDRVRIPKEAVGVEGSSMYLQEGQVLTVQELLYGLMLRSGNDAAVALAIYCAGTVEGFAELMNDTAAVIGLADTHFVNPHGLDAPDHYSTARDLAILAAYAMENPIFAHTVSTKSVTVGDQTLQNHNKLLWQFSGADGVKTGYTKACGRILVSSAVRQGRRLICVTMDDPADWQDHKSLLEQGFSDFQMQKLIHCGQVLGHAQLADSREGSVALVAAQDFSYPLAAGERPKIQLPAPGFVYAPVEQGQMAGWAVISLDQQQIGRVPLYYGSTVQPIKEEKIPFWKRLFGGES